MWQDAVLWLLLASGGAAFAATMVLGGRWCPLGCFTRQPKAYGENYATDEYDALLPQLSPIVYYHSGTTPDFECTLHALTRARTAVEVNDALSAPALEWLFTTAAEAHEFVALCTGHVDFSAIMVNNLASLVVGLQQYAASEPIAQFITDCFRAKVAGDLLRLKHEIEKRVPVYEVVFVRIQSKLLRECILTHMELQARVLRATRGFEAPVKLLSEIDDTVFAVHHDAQYPNLTVYPGIQQFSKEVLGANSLRRQDGRASLDNRDQRQVFFTKRAELWRQQAEEELATSGFEHYTRTVTEMLGSAESAFQHKLQTIRQFKRIFGECELVFVGHNGQNDVALGLELIHHPHLYSVSAVLIHDVLRQQPPSATSHNVNPIRFFRTYVGAAFQLCQLNLISLNAAARVARAASVAFRAIPFERTEQQDLVAMDLAAEVIDLLEVLAPRDANVLAALLPRAAMRFLADRLQADEADDGRHLIV